ncbi:MAG TPA: sterol desaturase family protein [Candidatus Binataceae bacterium]|nr:sterol desaturase family protein [Candidatus Binataceae bacterium]
MVEDAAILVTGLLSWTLLEYLIHGWLSHLCTTAVSARHAVHHRDPHAVFVVRAWRPLAVIWIAGLAAFGWSPGMIFFAGLTLGFAAYEVLHYRMHFCRPRGSLETWMRARHLIHHRREPQRCLGVTTPFWDLVFGTEPISEMDQLIASVAASAPLTGPTNLWRLFTLPYFGSSRLTPR